LKRFAFVFMAVMVWAGGVQAAPLRFLYHTGDQYRYYGTSSQTVTLDHSASESNLLTYRIAFSVFETNAHGDGHLKGHITYLSQSESSKASAIQEEFDTDYWVDPQGKYTVPPDQVMPVVRDVPWLPDGDVKTGDTWVSKGEEVHDLRQEFGVDRLLRVPFDVVYTDEGEVQKEGKPLIVIRADYNLYFPTGFTAIDNRPYPVLMSGFSHQTHDFNAEKGREEGYHEEYTLILTLNNGHVLEYSGTGESHLVEARVMDKPAVAAQVKKDLAQKGLGDLEVTAVPQGVTIHFDSIHFPGDSSELLPEEQRKLNVIGDVLKKYADRDVLVEGYTASVPGGRDPQTLSQERAAAVGNYLVATGVRSPQQLVYKGWGDSKPVASNDTEAGRTKNRRVEITILEN